MAKFFTFVALCCVLVVSLPSVAGAGEARTLTVFAAASMTESMNRIAELYKQEAPDTQVVYNFDSSGTLKTQIQSGAECDIFISAANRQMDQLDITANPAVNTEKLDFVMPGTRFNLVSNKVVLIVPKGKNSTGIASFEDVTTDKASLVALGNSDVPVGQYSKEIFTHLGIWDKLQSMSKVTFASNVKEVLVQVASAAVSCGVVYGTDAATSNGVEVVAEAPTGSHTVVTYPAAILKTVKDEKAARAFLDFLKSDACSKVFKEIGFAIPSSR